MTNPTCPIWGTHATVNVCTREDIVAYDSLRAGGQFLITKSALAKIQNGFLTSHYQKEELSCKIKLTSHILQQNKFGTNDFLIDENFIGNLRVLTNIPIYRTIENLMQKFDDITSKSLFIYLKDNNTLKNEIGAIIEAKFIDNNLEVEIDNYLLLLEEKKYIRVLNKYHYQHGIVSRHLIMNFEVTPQGKELVYNLNSKNQNSKQVFVPMWFNEETADAYESGIRQAILDSGYEPMRIDKKEHNNKIDDEIIAEIRKSKFLVADFTHGATGVRGGVYFEAGFAQGLGIPVIWTCRDDMIKEVHFDTRQYSHILWKTPEDLSISLKRRIEATIGRG